MYPNNEGPRSTQEESINAPTDTYSTQQVSVSADNNQDKGENDDKEAMTTRTPERWWLRKRLTQS